ncbi:MAG: transglutaminase, partial [Gemmatimonadetes bacterium]|nr:transglutaminase [Gemmatimonadota bacterium]
DISNQISPDEKYVRIASGFDYSDVQPVAGLRFGDGEETMTTQVIIQ